MSKKEFVFVLIITALVILAWAFSDLLHTATTYTVSTEVEALEQPFDASFPQDTLKQIKSLGSQSPASSSASLVPLPSPVPPSALGISTSSARKK